MGNKQAGNERNVGGNIRVPQDQKNQVTHLLDPYINQAFVEYSSGVDVRGQKTMNQDKFCESLIILEKFGIKRLRNTPLGERLFQIFDRTKSGSLNQKEFTMGMNQLINNPQYRIKCTFEAITKNSPIATISQQQFVNYFKESWLAAFRILGEIIHKETDNKYKLSQTQINLWATENVGSVESEMKKKFDIIANRPDAQSIDFNEFTVWFLRGECDVVKAQIENFEVEILTTLKQFEVKFV